MRVDPVADPLPARAVLVPLHVVYRQQRYDLHEVVPVTTRRGRKSRYLVLATTCPCCGQACEAEATVREYVRATRGRPGLRRRCSTCAKAKAPLPRAEGAP